MAFEGYKNQLAGKLQGAQLENQLARQARQDQAANQLLELKRQQQFRDRPFQPVPVVDEAGNVQLVGPSFSANDGRWNVSPLGLPEGTSLLRQTPQQKSSQKVSEKREISEIETKAAKEKEAQKVFGKTFAERAGAQVDTAYEAASAIPILTESLKLLEDVETGGIDAVKLRAKQVLGIESADEAELTQNLSKAVLKQLRPTFGAQFTKAEGDFLKRIEAGLGKSTEGNKRLLKRALQIYQDNIKRGIKAAEISGDEGAYSELQSRLNYTFSPIKETPPAQDTGGWAIIPE
jgi:hypothetical protein